MQTYYGNYGGQFVAQALTPALDEVTAAYERYKIDPEFIQELHYYSQTFAGRPTALTYAQNLSEHFGGAQIYFKREDLTTIGAHKINHAIYQALLAKRMGKKILIAETGAGMHGVSTATVGAKFGMKTIVFMGEEDIQRQQVNVQRMKLLGAEVISVTDGSQTLKDAVTAALKYRTNNLSDSYYLLGSALGPAPYPQIVRQAQSIIGKECLTQFPDIAEKEKPDYVVACVGGGSNAIGIFSAYLDDESVKLVGVEAGGTDPEKLGKHACRIFGQNKNTVETDNNLSQDNNLSPKTSSDSHDGVFQGYKSKFLQDDQGNIALTSSISAGLDYPGIGPEHAYLADIDRVDYQCATDDEVIAAFRLTAQQEGIIPALESSHALAYAYKLAPTLGKDQTILVNISGRGDKDLHTVLGLG